MPTLTEDRRTQLDGIVKQMTANQEPDTSIQSVVTDFKIKYGVTSPDQASAATYHPLIPASTGEGPVAAGLKAVANVPSSAFNVAKSTVDAVVHPIRTALGVRDVVA